MQAAGGISGSTGIVRLLEHCEALGRMTAGEPDDPRLRLEATLGHELAGRLVGALTRRHARGAVMPV